MCISKSTIRFGNFGDKIVYKNFRVGDEGIFNYSEKDVPKGKFQGLYHKRLYELGETYNAEVLRKNEHKFIHQKYYVPGFHGYSRLYDCFDGYDYSTNKMLLTGVAIKCKLFDVYAIGFDIMREREIFVGKRIKLIEVIKGTINNE